MKSSRSRSYLVGPRCSGAHLTLRIRRNPVRFPGLATVAGKRLLEPAEVARLALDDEFHEDRAAVQRVLVVELAAAVPELADCRAPSSCRRGCSRNSGSIAATPGCRDAATAPRSHPPDLSRRAPRGSRARPRLCGRRSSLRTRPRWSSPSAAVADVSGASSRCRFPNRNRAGRRVARACRRRTRAAAANQKIRMILSAFMAASFAGLCEAARFFPRTILEEIVKVGKATTCGPGKTRAASFRTPRPSDPPRIRRGDSATDAERC